MKNKLLIFLFAFVLLIPTVAFAQNDPEETDIDEGFTVVAETTKYYKTITTFNSEDFESEENVFNAMRNSVSSVTIEVTEEEYNNAREEDHIIRSNPTTIETTYKRMTTSIASNGSYYRYKNILNWKYIPSVRSYDIIAIGFLGDVKPHGIPSFVENYCRPNGNCSTITQDTVQIFTYGSGTSFSLPSGDLASLKATFWFDVEKNTNNTITIQKAYGDYAHATTTVSILDATNYQVIQSSGIVLGSSISSSYDNIQVADASWYGTW